VHRRSPAPLHARPGHRQCAPFLNTDVGQSKHMFDNPHEISRREAIKRAKTHSSSRITVKGANSWGNSLRSRRAIGRCLAAPGSAGSST
jgi:hypothetical protein